MKLSYRKAYLTDGTQVKITEELYQQLKQWEQEGYKIPYQYSDMLKQEDDEMINANRKYYRHNISLDQQMLRAHLIPTLMHDKRYILDEQVVRKDRSRQIIKVLNICTETQRRRFVKYYYLGHSYAEIAKQENCYESAVRKSIGKAEKLIISQKNLF